MQRTIIATTCFITMLSPAFAQADDESLIAKVKTTWRAQDGETAEQIITKVAKVAHFIPREWEVGQKNESGTPVFFSWARHRTDTEDNEYSISWSVGADGTMTIGPLYAKPMELGWQAFALSLIQGEIDDGDQGANYRFLHDVSNLSFVQTSQGKLGDLLKRGRCTLGDPVGVDYVDSNQQGDFFRLQLSVDCDIPGPKYFTHDGVIIFVKNGAEPWHPQSSFAHRIATNPPGSWFDRVGISLAQEFDNSLVLTLGRLFTSAGGYSHQVVSVENKGIRTIERIEVECGFYAGTQLLASDNNYIRGLRPASIGHADIFTANAGGATSLDFHGEEAR